MTSFMTIPHPALQIPWLLQSLDEVFAIAGDRLDVVRFGIDGDRGIEDKTATYVGYVYFETNGSDGLSEDEKDAIPAVRRMERQVENLRFHLPMAFDVDGRSQGDWHFSARRDSMLFVMDQRDWETDGPQIHVGARLEDGVWQAFTEVRFDLKDETLTLDGPQALLETRLDTGTLRIPPPQVVSVDIRPEQRGDEGDAMAIAMIKGSTQLVFIVGDDSFAEMGQPEDDD